MATNSSIYDLAQILGTDTNSRGAGGAGDINDFQRTIAAHDIYNQIAAPIVNAKFNTEKWTPNQTIATAAAQSFLGSLFKELGQRSEGAQIAQVANVLPQLYRDPASVALPTGVDEAAFGALKMDAMSKRQQTDETIRQILGQKGVAANPDGSLSMMPHDGPIGDIFSNPDLGATRKEVRDLENTTYNRIANSPEYKMLSDIKTNFKALESLSKQDTKAADIGMISTIARIRDPLSTVREGEYKMNAETQAYLDQLSGNWRQIITGDSRFKPLDKMNIIASVAPKYNEMGASYLEARNPQLAALSQQGGNPLNIPTPDFSPYELDRKYFIDEAKKAGLTMSEAKKKWQDLGGK